MAASGSKTTARGQRDPHPDKDASGLLREEVHPSLVQRPLLWGAAAYVTGLSVSSALPASFAVPVAVLMMVVAVRLSSSRRLIALILLPATYFSIGWTVHSLQRPPAETVRDAFGGTLPDGPVVIEGRIRRVRSRSRKGQYLLVDAMGAGRGPVPKALKEVSGRLELFVGSTAPYPCGRPGDRIRFLARLRRPRPQLFEGGFSRRQQAMRRGVALEAFVRDGRRCLVLAAPVRFELVRTLEDLRVRVQLAVDERLAGDVAGLVRALATGDRSGLSDRGRDALRQAGLSHLVAVSGFHLGVVAWLWLGGLSTLLRRCTWAASDFGAHRWAALLAVPVVCIYPLFVGATPSALRAGLMVLGLVTARLLSRSVEAWSVLAVALLAMAAVDPSGIGDPGLQLSFSAVASLMRLPSAWERQLGWSSPSWSVLPRAVWSTLMASMAATAGTAPVVAWHFGQLSLVGVVANIPAAVLAVVAVPLALGGALTAMLWPSLGSPVLLLAGLVAEMLLGLAISAAQIPGATVALPAPSLVEVALYYIGLIALSTLEPSRICRRLGYISWAVLACVLVSGPVSRRLSRELRVTFLPVGQGDGIVAELPGGKVVVIDAGPSSPGWDAGVRVLVPFLRARRISSIDLFIATHPHADHIGGLPGLMGEVRIDRVWWTGDGREGPEAALDALRGLTAGAPLARHRFEGGGAVVDRIGPHDSFPSYPLVNDASIVVRIRYGWRSILLTGDAELYAEGQLVDRLGSRGLRADVIKAGHHGSRTSSSRRFLEATGAKAVVVSCGLSNGFGFPHRETLERFQTLGLRVWRTDVGGAVTVATDGRRLDIWSHVGQARARD